MSPLVEPSIKELAELIGPLPPGDTPAAWYYSTDPQVLAGYLDFERAHRQWRTRIADLVEISGISFGPSDAPERIRVGGLGGDYLIGLKPPQNLHRTPRWWRYDKTGYLVPRKKTREEKASEVNQAFAAVRKIPRAVDYLPGCPNTLWLPQAAFPVSARRPGRAVLVFVGADPLLADPPFELSAQYERLKMSTFHLLRERQAAENQV